MNAWSDDPAFWAAMEPALAAPARLARAADDVAEILAATRPPAGERVLDLGCGPGAHAIAFAERGCRVTGVDASRRLLDRARGAARRAGVEVEWVEADMRTFRRPAAFDLACSLYASFGFFDDDGNRRVLEHLRASLAPGGAVVLDVLGREAVARAGEVERRFEVEGVGYVERRRGDAGWRHLLADWTVVRGGERSAFHVRQRLYSGAELEALLESAGFVGIRIAATLDGAVAYDASAARLVGVGQA